ncbi:MAG: CoA transferase [Gammaproteobacteria bacterium]|jgi:crotonobetainyl-CoA:carnitine CoA-transferase CaiB-like acyl-CoA transferase|nr:CoA transferase [Gammaproteobacteria bacterium]MBP6050277.1 CoA transferase [Pseudomonadales bacterium]MBK7169704.1 CoA transferase [Gammaproteobacteria bacterium]MBK7522141.1 CoA transferase [Gammaproteobacteria bacterium]MBK7727386.1 CoA transferase [Gammaproteobacteria bacterium]
MSEQKPSAGPLEGLRVLDISTMLAGPYGATLLGDLGADVIRVESHYGDESRHLGPLRGTERGPYLSLNRNKRDIVIDLREEGAREVFARLVRTADVLISNIREPALSKLGLNYEQVAVLKPDIVWVGVTAFGPDGPYAGRPGIDFLAQGYAGVLALNGDPDGEPVRTGFPAVDVITSLLVANAAQAALRVRDRTGAGQRVEVSLLDALMHAQASSIGTYLATGEAPVRTGNRSLYFAPSGVYPTRDGGHVVITTPGEKFFVKLCRALEVDWDTDPRFHDIAARLTNQDELDRVVAERTQAYTREELLPKLIAADVLTAPINQVEDVVRDPQILHNNMIVPTSHPLLGEVRVTGVPIRFYETPGSVRLHPPLLGEHTFELLGELGYSAEEAAALVREGLVADHGEIERRRLERNKSR